MSDTNASFAPPSTPKSLSLSGTRAKPFSSKAKSIPWKLERHLASTAPNSARSSIVRRDGECDGFSMDVASVMEKVDTAVCALPCIPVKDGQVRAASYEVNESHAIVMTPEQFATASGVARQVFKDMLFEETRDDRNTLMEAQAHVDSNIILQSFARSFDSNALPKYLAPEAD